MKPDSSPILFYYVFIVLLLFSAPLLAQQKPQYDPAKSFHDYQKKMNDYYQQTKDKNGYNQWKRLEWYYSTRLGNDGKLADMQQMKQDALQKGALLKANIVNQPEQVTGAWSQVGPTAVTQSNEGIGRVNRLAFHPTDVNAIWAATAGGGLWKTTNGGSSWQPLTDGLPNLNLSGVAVNPLNTNIIYILTGDADGGGPGNGVSVGKYSTGVLKSTDGGVSWNYTGLKWNETEGRLGYKLLMHISDFSTLFVAASTGIYRTTNAGASWTQVLQNEKVYDIEFMPNNPLVVYAGADGGKFFRSMDGGSSWTMLYDNTNPYADRVSIAVTPDYSSAVYMLISNDNGSIPDSAYTFNGLYYSDNMGASGSWIKRASHLPDVFSGDGTELIGRQQLYDHSLVVSPFDNNKVYTGGISIFRSTNGGTTLNYVDNNIAGYHVDVHELAYNGSGSALYAATDGGVYKTTNGTGWTALNNNLTITQYYRISVSNANSAHILGGAQDNGTHFRSSVNSVFAPVTGQDGTDNAISVSSPSIMYSSSNKHNFWRSSDNGNSFNLFCNDSILADQIINANGFWVTNIEVSPSNGNIVFLGYNPVVKGSYNGTAWTFTAIGFQAYISGRTILEVAPSNANIIYAGDNDYNDIQKLWRTTDGGANWTNLNVPYSAQRFTKLAVNPDDPNEVWLTYGGYDSQNKVFRSLNGGSTWTNITGSLPNVPVNCIVYDDNNGNPDDALYIGTDIGVFYRDNSLGDWIPFSNGLPVVEVTDLEINESAGLLRAGTYGRGIWQTSVYNAVCAANPVFTIHPPSEPGFFSATNTITSTALITGAGAHIQYKAGQRVTMNPGFKIDANSGAKFISFIGPCPGGGVPPGYYHSTFNGLTGYLKE